MVVSIDIPFRRAHRLDPLPRCAKMARSWHLRAKTMHQRFIRKPMKSIAANARIEVALRDGEVRCDFRHGLVKSIVEAGKLHRRRKDRSALKR